jgi:hypothetical protein
MIHPAVAALNRQLASKGEPVVLRRPLTTNPVTYQDVTVQAFVRGYKPQELIGGINQGDSIIILSPTQMVAAGWPIPPKASDKAVYQGRTRNVQTCSPITIGSTAVRYELQVRG